MLSEIRARWSRPSYDPEYWGDDDVRWLISEVDRLRAALGRSVPAEPTPQQLDAATDELFEALGEGYGISRDHAKGLAFRALNAALRGAPPQGEPPTP